VVARGSYKLHQDSQARVVNVYIEVPCYWTISGLGTIAFLMAHSSRQWTDVKRTQLL